MKKNKRLEERRTKISKDVDTYINHSFEIVDCIFEILVSQGKEQKDLAKALGKTESEISKWMTGTHNFTLKTIAKIEEALGERIFQIRQIKHQPNQRVLIISNSNYIYSKAASSSMFQKQGSSIIKSKITPVTEFLN